MSVHVRLEQNDFDPLTELGELLDQSAGEGAVVSFVGMARTTAKDGDRVDRLVLEHHPILTQRSLDDIATGTAQRFAVSHIRVVHRCGGIMPGEPIVFAAATAPHRRAAFEAADYLMDRLKTEAVFWKREESDAGSKWIEPTETDYADRDRWG